MDLMRIVTFMKELLQWQMIWELESIGKMIHAHPTLSEAFMEAIHQLEGKINSQCACKIVKIKEKGSKCSLFI